MSRNPSRTQSNADGDNRNTDGHQRTTVKETSKTSKGTMTGTGDTSGGNTDAASHKTTSEVQPRPRHLSINPMCLSYIGYGIYVGNLLSACSKFLEANGFTHVLSVGKQPREELPDKVFKKKFVEAEDGPGANVEEIFDACFSFIDEGIQGKNKILVHCWGGYSRSITVVVGYLHHRKNFSWKQGYLWVANKRPQLTPDAAFRKYMAERASKENGGRLTFTVDDFTLPGQDLNPQSKRIEANKKHIESLDLKKLFSGCEEDKRKIEPLVFWTSEGEKA